MTDGCRPALRGNQQLEVVRRSGELEIARPYREMAEISQPIGDIGTHVVIKVNRRQPWLRSIRGEAIVD